jgi:hypothetical protein
MKHRVLTSGCWKQLKHRLMNDCIYKRVIRRPLHLCQIHQTHLHTGHTVLHSIFLKLVSVLFSWISMFSRAQTSSKQKFETKDNKIYEVPVTEDDVTDDEYSVSESISSHNETIVQKKMDPVYVVLPKEDLDPNLLDVKTLCFILSLTSIINFRGKQGHSVYLFPYRSFSKFGSKSSLGNTT